VASCLRIVDDLTRQSHTAPPVRRVFGYVVRLVDRLWQYLGAGSGVVRGALARCGGDAGKSAVDGMSQLMLRKLNELLFSHMWVAIDLGIPTVQQSVLALDHVDSPCGCQEAAALLIGKHDFSSFRGRDCQAK
jgi:hypothetical protein